MGAVAADRVFEHPQIIKRRLLRIERLVGPHPAQDVVTRAGRRAGLGIDPGAVRAARDVDHFFLRGLGLGVVPTLDDLDTLERCLDEIVFPGRKKKTRLAARGMRRGPLEITAHRHTAAIAGGGETLGVGAQRGIEILAKTTEKAHDRARAAGAVSLATLERVKDRVQIS